MMSVKFCLDSNCFMSKPIDKKAATISDRIGKYVKQACVYDLRATAIEITLNVRSFCPATFKDGKRRKENF